MENRVHSHERPAPASSTPARIRVLLLEDNRLDAELSVQALAKAGFEVISDRVDTEGAFNAMLRSGSYDLVLADYNIPAWNGMDALRSLQRDGKDIPFLLVTGSLSAEAAVEIIKEGATDYILKEHLMRLPTAVRRALADKEARVDSERTRRALDSSRARMQRVFESSIMGISIGDVTGRLHDGNEAFLKIVGYSREELESGAIRWDTLTAPEYRYLDQENLRRLLETGRTPPWEKQYIRKDGTRVSVLIAVTTLASPEGPDETISFVLDISEHKQIEDHLQRLAAVVESTHDAIISKSLDGTILTWNLGAERMYGYTPSEVIGKSVNIIIPVDHRQEFHDILEKISAGKIVQPFETARLRKDGKQVAVSLTVSPIRDMRGVIVGASAIARDITESKHLEKMFRQAQKMEAVGRLAGGVAHDFNNLLGVIIGYGEMICEQLRQGDPLRAKVEQITKAGQRAAALTRQLLAFSRQQLLEPKTLSLNNVVTEIQKMLERLIGEDIELVTSLDSLLAPVKADQGQLEQVIMNLVVNARDAMPAGGRVTLETANIELDDLYVITHPGCAPGSYVMFAVSDTGTGMDAETLKHMFEPFFTTKEQGKGTGLGLATVYGIVQQSGGYISVYSERGHGTIFKIYLPRIDGVAPGERASGNPSAALAGTETVLLVEDEESLRNLTREVLEASGYTVLEAADGEEALGIAEKYRGRIDLLLTDVVMPKMGGPALARLMVAANLDLKVLFMSGYTGSNLVPEIDTPRSGFVQKPFTRDTLTRKMRELLGSLTPR